jgi:Leucine-rich repeat (LRR) protein
MLLIEQKKIKNILELKNCQKYHYVFLGMFLISSILGSELYAQTFKVPDANFEKKLIDMGIDTDRQVNGLAVATDVNLVTEISIPSSSIFDLTGIEVFVQLEKLDIAFNKIQQLNIDKLSKLKHLNCDNNSIRSLNLDAHPLLEILACSNNLITELDLTSSSHIQKVSCTNNKLKVFRNPHQSLEYLNISRNFLFELDVTQATALEKLICSDNYLVCLDLSRNPKLDKLVCNDNNLQTLCLKNGNNPNIKCFKCHT